MRTESERIDQLNWLLEGTDITFIGWAANKFRGNVSVARFNCPEHGEFARSLYDVTRKHKLCWRCANSSC